MAKFEVTVTDREERKCGPFLVRVDDMDVTWPRTLIAESLRQAGIDATPSFEYVSTPIGALVFEGEEKIAVVAAVPVFFWERSVPGKYRDRD